MSSKYNKRLFFLLIMLMMTIGANAQNDLHIETVFERFGNAKGCKMVELHDGNLKGYELKIYKSITYKKIGNSIEVYLKLDRNNAKKVREVVQDGKIISGYYMMSPIKSGINRYILFKNDGNSNGTVIYIEGELSPDELMKLCTTIKRNK